jgi:NAD(P)-dependent dehydrogenase (short-subunit alcohol dehydrogenase family)
MANHTSTAMVTGGTSGIGLACAEALLHAGTRALMIVGRDAARGAQARDVLIKAAPDADIRFVAADVRAPHDATRAVEACVSAFGRIDTIVSCAGGSPLPRLIHDIPIEAVADIIGSITSGILLPARAALGPMMRQGGGAIVCIASDAAKVATPGEAVIGAAMAAVAMFCRTLAIEAKRSGIRVNCVTPSIVRDTPFYDTLMADPFCSRLFSKAEKLAMLGVVEPKDIGETVAFLASPAAARLTGQTISVNGGISAA